MKFISKLIFLLLIIPLTIYIGACSVAEPEQKLPSFEITSLYIQPDEVMTGDKVSITATVANKGEVEGTYQAVLKMGQSEISSDNIIIPAAAAESINFDIKAPAAGNYIFSVGDVEKTLTVNAWKKYEMRYFKCETGEFSWITNYTYFGNNGGLLSYFTPPSNYFKVQKLHALGYIHGSEITVPENYHFTIRIWSNKLKEVLWYQNFPYSTFHTVRGFKEIEVPDIRTGGNFYVEIQTRSAISADQNIPRYALYIGLCDRTDQGNADVAYKGEIQKWPDGAPPKESSSFMVSVDGEIGPPVND